MLLYNLHNLFFQLYFFIYSYYLKVWEIQGSEENLKSPKYNHY